MVTSIALLYFEKETLGLSPAEAAGIAFWLGLPLSMKMVVGLPSGWLAALFGPRGVFTCAMALPVIVALSVVFIPRWRDATAAAARAADVLGGGRARLVLLVGLGYAVFGVALEMSGIAGAQEIVLVVSAALLSFLLTRMGVTRAVMVAALVIFIFRATPDVGQGYSYWAIDRLGFDERFLGLLAQVSSVLGLVGLLVFRQTIVRRPVSFTLFWVIVAGTIPRIAAAGGSASARSASCRCSRCRCCGVRSAPRPAPPSCRRRSRRPSRQGVAQASQPRAGAREHSSTCPLLLIRDLTATV